MSTDNLAIHERRYLKGGMLGSSENGVLFGENLLLPGQLKELIFISSEALSSKNILQYTKAIQTFEKSLSDRLKRREPSGNAPVSMLGWDGGQHARSARRWPKSTSLENPCLRRIVISVGFDAYSKNQTV